MKTTTKFAILNACYKLPILLIAFMLFDELKLNLTYSIPICILIYAHEVTTATKFDEIELKFKQIKQAIYERNN